MTLMFYSLFMFSLSMLFRNDSIVLNLLYVELSMSFRNNDIDVNLFYVDLSMSFRNNNTGIVNMFLFEFPMPFFNYMEFN